MIEHFPRRCFAALPELDLILAELMPDLSPEIRLEIFTQESGCTSVSHFKKCQLLVPEKESLSIMFARAAAEGRVLPLLVYSAAVVGSWRENSDAPDVSEVLKCAHEILDMKVFSEHLVQPIKVITGIRPLPARWLFLTAAKDVLLPIPETGDAFWVLKTREAFVPVLFLAPNSKSLISANDETIESLIAVSREIDNAWSTQVRERLQALSFMPKIMRSAILNQVYVTAMSCTPR